jgi:hypothetical protein
MDKRRGWSAHYLIWKPIAITAISGLCAVAVIVLDLVSRLGVPNWLLYAVPFIVLNQKTTQDHIHSRPYHPNCRRLFPFLRKPTRTGKEVYRSNTYRVDHSVIQHSPKVLIINLDL